MSEIPWEDSLVERKTENDLKDLLKTMVAFANSVKPGHVATILIGEKDDGSIQGVKNPEKIQNTVIEHARGIYPSIENVSRSKVYDKDGKQCVRVEIEYSGETPHFGAPAWVRRGATTVKASEEVFQRLIDYRSGMVRELALWIGKPVTVEREDKRLSTELLVHSWFDESHAATSGMPTLTTVRLTSSPLAAINRWNGG